MLQEYFNSCRWSTFLRQLRFYGFKKRKNLEGLPEFTNPNFIKGKYSEVYAINKSTKAKSDKKCAMDTEHLLIETQRLTKSIQAVETEIKLMEDNIKLTIQTVKRGVISFLEEKSKQEAIIQNIINKASIALNYHCCTPQNTQSFMSNVAEPSSPSSIYWKHRTLCDRTQRMDSESQNSQLAAPIKLPLLDLCRFLNCENERAKSDPTTLDLEYRNHLASQNHFTDYSLQCALNPHNPKSPYLYPFINTPRNVSPSLVSRWDSISLQPSYMACLERTEIDDSHSKISLSDWA